MYKTNKALRDSMEQVSTACPLLICDGTVEPVKAKISIKNDTDHPIVKSNKIDSESGDLLLLIIYGITTP